MKGDALSTAIFVAGLDKGLGYLAQFPRTEVVIVDKNLQVFITQGLNKCFQVADAPSRRETRELTFSDVKFKNLVDGTYIGEFKGEKSRLRDAKVEVTISGGEITDIAILKGAVDKEGKPAKLTGGRDIDDLFNTAIQAQTLQVDVVSGATLTSKAHLKALENALEQAQVKD